MKVALFLYPIYPYLENRLHACDEPARFRERREALDRVLDLRFRSRGWQMVWALFRRDDCDMPDTELLAPVFRLHEDDAIATVDVSFNGMLRGTYPRPSNLLRKLGALTELAVCGFHCTDCVERVAFAAHHRGIQTKAHSDLTEYFFSLDFYREPGSGAEPTPAILLATHECAEKTDFLGQRLATIREDNNRLPWRLPI